MNLELSAKVQQWRQKSLAGTLTHDEMREAVKALREGRVSASVASSKSKARKAPVDVNDLLGQLDGL